jgi:transcriptional regulator with XRE-family HTH domain
MNEIYTYSIHDRIRRLRESKGWSCTHLARQLKVSHTDVLKWESGETTDLKLLHLMGLYIYRLFCIDPADLITGKPVDSQFGAKNQIECEILQGFRAASQDNQETMLDIAKKSLLKSSSEGARHVG